MNTERDSQRSATISQKHKITKLSRLRSGKYNWRYRSSLLLISFGSLLFPSLVVPLLPNSLKEILISQINVVVQAQDAQVSQRKVFTIGVLAIRGKDTAIEQWQPHAEYLSDTISEYDFKIVPLTNNEIESAVAEKQVDFVISNPGMYVNLETKYGINRFATLKNLRLGESYTNFGAVILTKADRNDIEGLKDFKGKTFMGVAENAFGGWQMAWDQFLDNDVNPQKDFTNLSFGGTHDDVVMAVLNGEVDGGTVRTDTLERMAREGKIKVEDFKIINKQPTTEEFPFVRSTPLYPEWAFSGTEDISLDVVEEIARSLLNMPENSAAAVAAKSAGWTVPLNYRPVHELFIDLRLPPYEDLGRFTTAQLIQRLSIFGVAALLAIGGLIIYFQKRSLAEQKEGEKALNELNKSLEITAEEQRQQKEQQQKEKEQLEAAIYTLIDEIADATDGDLTVRANLDSLELSTVADLFNAIIDNLQEIAIEARDSSSLVGSSLQQNEREIRLLAQQAITEAEETRNTLISVEQMSESIQAVADNASQAEQIADDTYNTVLSSATNMDSTVDSILNLRNTVGETSKKMKRLGESSQKISQAVSFIEEIALRTNILAINATVEAGRAGEYGQGFTIVAEQVAGLAEQSAAATKEIAKIVAEIQTETQGVNSAMESGTSQVVETTRLIESTRESLDKVLEKSRIIDQLMKSISQSTVSQAGTSRNVTDLMQKIAQLSETTSQSSEKVAKSIVETAQVAQKLESAVAQFKVAESA